MSRTATNVDRRSTSEQAVGPPGDARSHLEVWLTYADTMDSGPRRTTPHPLANPEAWFGPSARPAPADHATAAACPTTGSARPTGSGGRSRPHTQTAPNDSTSTRPSVPPEGDRLLRELLSRPAHRRHRDPGPAPRPGSG